jgi:DNA-binding protein HU-beta
MGVNQMAAKKPTKAQATITLKNLAAELAESHEVPKKQTQAMLSDMVALIGKHLKKGDRLRLVGLVDQYPSSQSLQSRC